MERDLSPNELRRSIAYRARKIIGIRLREYFQVLASELPVRFRALLEAHTAGEEPPRDKGPAQGTSSGPAPR